MCYDFDRRIRIMKKFSMSSIGLLFLFSHNTLAQVDYSKCREFMHTGTGAMSYAPFDLQSNGRISPHQNVLSYSYDKSKKQDIIVYEIRRYESPTTSTPSSGRATQNAERVRVVIQRDEQGNIVEFIKDNDYQLSQADLDRQVRQLAEWSKQGMQIPFSRLSRSTVKFEIKNGQCVPIVSKSTVLVGPKINGRKSEMTHFNTNLCKDIDDFLKSNPEAASCFKKNLNDKISSIFDKYKNDNTQSQLSLGLGVPYGIGIGSHYGPSYYGPSLEQRLSYRSGNFPGTNDLIKERLRKLTGTSPVISAHMILQNCHQQGLFPFIEDAKIWEKTDGEAQTRSGATSTESR